MDGAVVCVPGRPLAAQGGKAGGQTHQRYRDANPGNHVNEKLFYTNPKLVKRSRREKRCREIKSFFFLSDHKEYMYECKNVLMQVCEVMWMYFAGWCTRVSLPLVVCPCVLHNIHSNE